MKEGVLERTEGYRTRQDGREMGFEAVVVWCLNYSVMLIHLSLS